MLPVCRIKNLTTKVMRNKKNEISTNEQPTNNRLYEECKIWGLGYLLVGIGYSEEHLIDF